MNILIIDDSETTRRILRSLLEEIKCAENVFEAGDGQAALRVLADATVPIHLALVDWDMPVMDGLEFLRALRANPKFDTVVALMVTAQSDMSRVMEAINNGAKEYIMKPFTRDILEDKLRILGLIP